MSERLTYFRPGEESRMLARCQFGLERDGKCSAILTYPIEGYPWRRNPLKIHEFEIDAAKAGRLFDEIYSMREEHPGECLEDAVLWSDHSEKANGVTRDRETDTACQTIAIYEAEGTGLIYYSMKENSKVLLKSELYRTVMALIAPYEELKENTSLT